MHVLMRLSLALLLCSTTVARAYDVDDLDDVQEGHRDKTMYQIVPLGPGESVDPRLAKRDLAYIDAMSRHHAGAQEMSRDYLGDPRGTNPVVRKLAAAIIANQDFEIAVLATARESVTEPPRVLDAGLARIGLRELGVDGLEHRRRFIPWPTPSRLELTLLPSSAVSAYDVAWAKGMTMHHQGALDMARAYGADPMGQNRVLRLLNVDIVREQHQEIGFMADLMARYPGDAAAVEPIMPMGMAMGSQGGGMEGGHHGMPGMSH